MTRRDDRGILALWGSGMEQQDKPNTGGARKQGTGFTMHMFRAVGACGISCGRRKTGFQRGTLKHQIRTTMQKTRDSAASCYDVGFAS